MPRGENSNEWINWIEEAIDKNHIKHYDYNHFRNIQEIGSGEFGKVYRANRKNSEKYFALKSFNKLDDVTVKEIVHELKLQRDVDFHDNVISFYGIAKSESENDQLKKYWLVMEYADGGTLRNYLKEHFNDLTWGGKYRLAHQLARATLCLHDEGIIHLDLHSKNVLVHQNNIKLTDFGLSRRIEEVVSNSQSELYGIIPYIDPKRFNLNLAQTYMSDEKSDVYSVGILLWEISSGQPPFKDDQHFDLTIRISQGLREKIVPGTPEDYAKVYTECWNSEPNNRPTIIQVVEKLNDVIKNILFELADLIFKLENKFEVINQHVIIDYLNNDKISLKEIYSWLLNNQNNSNSIFLLGYFDYYGVEKNQNYEKAFNLFLNASEQNHIIAQYYIGLCYEFGYGTVKNVNLAFEHYRKTANQNCAPGQAKVGCFYRKGIEIEKNAELAVYWYQKAADNGNISAQNNLAFMYYNGKGVNKDYNKALELYQKAANNGSIEAQYNLALMYYNGEGVNKDYNKAFELYQKAANNGSTEAQYNLALMYYNGEGVNKDYNKAFELYQIAADNGIILAQYNLASMYEDGKGVDKDYNEAFELYQIAADFGLGVAHYKLALMYEFGKGVDKDYNKAIEHCQKAEDLGFDETQLQQTKKRINRKKRSSCKIS